jgi:hypothetical protein
MEKKEEFNAKVFFQRIAKNSRLKVLGIFLMIFSFFILEVILRNLSHFLVDIILFILLKTEIFAPGILISKVFSAGAPLIILGIPSMVYLWVTIRDGLQRFDWVLVPVLIGIVLKNGIYGILSLNQKSGEFWQLTTLYVPPQLLWIFILLFIFTSLIGFFTWFREIS